MILSVGAAFGNMAYFRENLCRLVCPYGRFQTALLDAHSPIVSYNVNRGEPRRDKKTQKVGQHKGDCIDCDLCNLVCPTGIDIREGLQIGCLACGLCVDACTTVMGKFKKETLIDYRTIEQVTNPGAKVHYLRGRTVVYGVILTILISAFTYLLVTRVPIYANAVRDKAITSIYVPGTGWQNGYEIHVGNLSHHDIDVRIDPEEGSPYKIIRTDESLHIPAGGYERVRYIVQYPESLGRPVANTMPIIFTVIDQANPKVKKMIKSTFTFPY
jgi:cytochrome c oxidase accessory protein FixG